MFEVIEYSGGFALRHVPTGEEHWLSDGVDVLFDDDEDGHSVAVWPGTPGFTERWSDAFNNNDQDEMLRVYFPHLALDYID